MTPRYPLAIQLYSGRKFQPLDSQIAVVASCGFTHVETFGPLNESPEETRRALDRHRLAAVSAHISLDGLEGDMAGAIKAARALGVEFVVAPFLCKRPWLAFVDLTVQCGDELPRRFERAAKVERER